MAVSEQDRVLVVEVRDTTTKQVSFSAIDLRTHEFIWQDATFDEPWWMDLSGVSSGIVLFTVYLDTTNPDRKAIFAHRLADKSLVWWNNDFSMRRIASHSIEGFSTTYGLHPLTLSLQTGEVIDSEEHPSLVEQQTVKPQQYLAGQANFELVKTFLLDALNLSVVTALEYLEVDGLIFVSCYVQENGLTNYLIILEENGTVLRQEKIGEQLKGIGLDTFFILAGSVFFVKNKTALVRLTIV